MFCSIWDDDEETGIHYTEELIPVCESLGMAKLPLSVGYAGTLFDGDAIVVTLEDKRNLYPQFSSLVSFDEYKKDKGMEVTLEEIQKVFFKLK